MSRIRADDPQSFDLITQNAFDDSVVCPAILSRNHRLLDSQCASDFSAMISILEIVLPQQIGRVTEQPRAHRIALAGNRIGSRSGATDLACDQGQIDDGLRCADSLVTLIDTHGPPEADSLAFVNRSGRIVQPLLGNAAFLLDVFRGKALDMLGKFLIAVHISLNELGVDPTFLDQDIRETVKHRKVRFWGQRKMLRRSGSGFCRPWIKDDNFGLVGIATNTLPHDGVGDAKIGADQDDSV